MRRIGGQAEPARPAGDGRRREEGGFEENIDGDAFHAGRQSAHDPGQRHRPAGIGNHQHVGGEFGSLAVQQFQTFARARHTYLNAAVETRQREGVHRLAQFEQHVVGDVDRRQHGPDATSLETLGHPARSGRLRIDAAHHAAQIERACLASMHLNRHGVLNARCRFVNLRQAHFGTGDRADLPRQALHRQAVRTVRRQLQGDEGIVQIQPAAEILAHRRIVGQHHQAVRSPFEPQFLGRTQHAEGLDPPHLGHLDLESGQRCARTGARHLEAGRGIRRPAHDGNRRRFTDVHLAHPQAIGIGMLLCRQDLGHHHIVEWRRSRRHGFHLQPCHGHDMGELCGIKSGIDEIAQPGFWKLHDVCALFS